ncbi:hypothetical protein [Caulobacter sp. 602-2]|uniref:hypothetical protein n=1 Tax=Caulobacter sp. 602-2 TaxID=2710887 RepID=UPI00196B34CE|nr:hypothetical protein [Caulobacter sp. 602-2]
MMTKPFQHQKPTTDFAFSKSEPKAQHGQKPDKDCVDLKDEKRSFEPRPGH